MTDQDDEGWRGLTEGDGRRITEDGGSRMTGLQRKTGEDGGRWRTTEDDGGRRAMTEDDGR